MSDSELNPYERRLRELRSRLPILTFYLAGKTQSGKTSIVHALTGRSREEIGQGFRPCTKSTRIYRFPTDEECFLQFVDMPGLGDAAQVGELFANSEPVLSNVHYTCLMVVMKALDTGQDTVRCIVSRLRETRPGVPVVVVQTCLHEGYPWREPRHIQPYPFAGNAFPATVPADLARALRFQRSWFPEPRTWFAAVDFTLPEDGFQPVLYGLEALWDAIEQAVPWGLREAIVGTPDVYRELADASFRQAHPIVVWYAIAAGTAAAIPFPLADLPTVLGIPALMARSLAKIYHQPWDSNRLWEITAALGFRFTIRYLSRQLTRLIPLVGPVASGGFIAASTYALGIAMCRYYGDLRRGVLPDAKVLRRLYHEELRQSREWLTRRIQEGFSGEKS